MIVSELKTSQEWACLDKSGSVVMDPDGWDRKNFQYSWHEELITQDEYNTRKFSSTVMPVAMPNIKGIDWGDK